LERIHADNKSIADLSFSVCNRRVYDRLLKPSSTHGSTCASVARTCTRVVTGHVRRSSSTRSAGVLHGQHNGIVNGCRNNCMHGSAGRRLGRRRSSSMDDCTASMLPRAVRSKVCRTDSGLTGSGTESFRNSGSHRVNGVGKRLLNSRLNGRKYGADDCIVVSAEKNHGRVSRSGFCGSSAVQLGCGTAGLGQSRGTRSGVVL